MDVTYCHFCSCMFSYAGIICAVHIRRKRSFGRSVMSWLEFMAAVWREDVSHATLLALFSCPYGQMQNVIVY